MINPISLTQIQQAKARKSSNIPALVSTSCFQRIEHQNPDQEALSTIATFIAYRDSCQNDNPKEKEQRRQELFELIESEQQGTQCPESLKLYQFLLELWHSKEPGDRTVLCDILAEIPLRYGAWRGIKSIFKQAESEDDWQIYGLILSRLDHERSTPSDTTEISPNTITYLLRRGWRTLKKCSDLTYADAVKWVLWYFPATNRINQTHLTNRVIYGTKHTSQHKEPFVYRHFAWQRNLNALFDIIQNTRHERIRQAALSFITKHCEFLIRDLSIEQVKALQPNQSAAIDHLIAWILEKDPRFEASNLIALNLHQTCLNLLHSTDQQANHFSVKYATVYAKDLATEALLPLLNHSESRVHQFALSLLQSRDPKQEVSFEQWGRILETRHGYKLASDVLIEKYPQSHFSSDWLLERLKQGHGPSYNFAKKWIEKHKFNFGALTYVDLLIEKKDVYDLVSFIFGRLHKINLSDLNQSIELQALLLEFDHNFHFLQRLIEENHLHVTFWSLPFLKSLVDGSSWENTDWWQHVNTKYPHIESSSSRYSLTSRVFKMLTDVRYFTPSELSLDWILGLCERPKQVDNSISEKAAEYLLQSFKPEEFLPAKESSNQAGQEEDISADLAHKTFLFTGQLATMTRSEAHDKVQKAQGCVAKSVTKTLSFLVIGDKGSPLYGEGKKGSKQLKAEQLSANGASVQIISEAAFLLMLSGKASVETADDKKVEAGCLHLWDMLCNSQSEHLRRVLSSYVQHHHPVLRLQSKDFKATTGGGLPESFFTFERIRPLVQHKEADLRLLGSALSHCHLHAWTESIPDFLDFCDHRDPHIARIFTQAFTCELTPETKGIYLNPESIRVEDVLYLCDHRSKALRNIGIYLLKKHPHLQQTQSLVSLIESEDHQVRTAIIHCMINDSSYQPSSNTAVIEWFRQVLFTIPSGRHPKMSNGNLAELKIKPLPSRQAKRKLLESLRDVAIEQIKDHKFDFAHALLTLLEEFIATHGKSEYAACLVAITRIEDQLMAKENEK
ncbi:hypothetical protein BS333_10040 [Vibrio azureus]|uniref:BRCT domain-containing protein n=1 Tax=Vibrio azureus NBRC 104587 TaxID=1219077 RepID=U3CBR3_9VIBR|nr:BRCT domain-containing protein [Vibrio azureus]AUI86701.1 hypothetical protein BS333_10040 [Vibrio azureus]GAD75798.1 hypothetical protein VAZ01S_031_00110 [Vibrio azureus NBRC 104587]